MILYGLAVLLTALSGVLGLLLRKHGRTAAAAVMVLGALAGLAASGRTLFGGELWFLDLPRTPLGTLGQLRFDPIAAFFLIPVLLLAACGSIYGLAYFDDSHEGARGVRVLYGLTTAFLALLVASAHAFTFLLAWEGMAITAFLLVITEDRDPETQRAGWIYLIATHAGTLCLFGAFSLMASTVGSFAFAGFSSGFAATGRGTLTFLLFLLGFGIKAGIFPFHFWLPSAHAAAPSHVSSIMSGVFIKMGILGLVRLLSWIPDPPLWWGGCLVVLGALSGILGVALALGQHDLKRLLAYHSIENIGIILLGLGIGTLGKSIGSPSVQILGYAGGLLHVLNHGLFKGLLFLNAGSVIREMGTRELEKMGALSRTMPVTSGTFLIGAWAICGLPPLNGFVSEWLIYLAAFQGLALSHLPWTVIALSALALIGALALACFAKACGAIFLGQPRSDRACRTQESPRAMQIPMLLLAGLCVGIGLAPLLLVPALDRLVASASGVQVLPSLGGFAHLGQLSAMAALLLGLATLCWCWAKPGSARGDMPTWDCGYLAGSPRMQYSASSFAEGLVSGMRFLLWPQVHYRRIAAFFPAPRGFHSHVPDPVLDRAAAPGLDLAARGFALLRVLQSGQLPLYLLYVLITLLTLLIWMVA
jgi:hydrogenase-4 component B